MAQTKEKLSNKGTATKKPANEMNKIAKPKPKKMKIEEHTALGNLRMSTVNDYAVPTYVAEIEKNIDNTHFPLIKYSIENSIKDADHYVNGHRALLHLVETAESLSVQQYNQKRIQLSFIKDKTFKIKISVSCILFFFVRVSLHDCDFIFFRKMS